MQIILFQGDRRPFVMETVKADDNAKLGMYKTFFIIILLKSFPFLPWTLRNGFKLFKWTCVVEHFLHNDAITVCDMVMLDHLIQWTCLTLLEKFSGM